jgi:DNA polymerase III subunit chi
MTRIDFYFNVANKSQTVADLVQAALTKRRQVTILAADEAAASQVSNDLWNTQPESFLPNVLANHAHVLQTPVLIDWDDKNLQQDDMLINLSAHEPSFFSRFTHLVELVGADEQDKTRARQRYKFYRDRGYEIKNIDQASLVKA